MKVYQLLAANMFNLIILSDFDMPKKPPYLLLSDRRGRDHVVVGFLTTYVIGAYHA
jgi:hypothetical protein